MLTASQQDRDIREARRLGVETYLVKPVDFFNFSTVTPQLNLRWALLDPAPAAQLQLIFSTTSAPAFRTSAGGTPG